MHNLTNWFNQSVLPSVSSLVLSYINWSYLYKKHLPQSWPFGKITNNRKTVRPNHSLSQKTQIFNTTWCKLLKLFSVLYGCVCQVRGLNAIQSVCKELDSTMSSSRGYAVVPEPNISWVPLSKNNCCEYYFSLPAVFRISQEILPQEQNFKLILQSV